MVGMEIILWIPIDLDKENRKRITKSIVYEWNGRNGASLYNLTEYAKLLDNIFGTNLVSQLVRDYGEFIQKPKKTFTTRISPFFAYQPAEYNKTRDIAAQSELFKNLLKSYNSISRECKKTEIDFEANEEYERRTFYEKSRFREGVRQITDGQSSSIIQEEGVQPNIEVESKRIDGGEQNPENNLQGTDEEQK